MKISVLIVDDNDTDRYLLKRFLTKTNYDFLISEANDGAQAIEFFLDYQAKCEEDSERYPPLLIFLDINMPKVDGFEFLEAFSKIRQEHNLNSTVVMMFTSSPRREDKQNTLKWDFVKEYIVKGEFGVQDLKKVIEVQSEQAS